MRKLLVCHWPLIAIIIIAAFLRFYNLTPVDGLPPGLYPDEAMNGNNALEALSTGEFKVFYPENNGREGLFINIQALFLAIFGNQPWALRLPSAIFGILTVLGLYFLAKELFKDRRVALLSSFFLATSFWHINFSRIGFRAIMAPFFLIWGIYFLLLAVRKNSFSVDNIAGERLKIRERVENLPGTRDEGKQGGKFSSGASLNFDARRPIDGKKNFFYAIIGGLFYSLGFYSYIAYRATPLLIFIILLFYWFKNKDSQFRKKILLSIFYFLISTLIIAAPLGLYFLQNPQDFWGRTGQISIFSAEGGSASGGNSLSILKNLSINIIKTAGMFSFMGDWNWRHNIAGKPLLFWPVGILFIIGLILSIIHTSKFLISNFQFPMKIQIPNGQNAQKLEIGNWELGIPLAWLAVAALPVVVSNEGIPHALRSLLMAPAVFILAGIGGTWLYKTIKSRIKSNLSFMFHVSCFMILSLFVFEAYYTYFIKWGENHNVWDAFAGNYARAAQELNKLPKEWQKYVIVEASGIDVRGIPMPSQTIMFITDTFTPEKQKEKNIYYVLGSQKGQVPKDSYVVFLK